VGPLPHVSGRFRKVDSLDPCGSSKTRQDPPPFSYLCGFVWIGGCFLPLVLRPPSLGSLRRAAFPEDRPAMVPLARRDIDSPPRDGQVIPRTRVAERKARSVCPLLFDVVVVTGFPCVVAYSVDQFLSPPLFHVPTVLKGSPPPQTTPAPPGIEYERQFEHRVGLQGDGCPRKKRKVKEGRAKKQPLGVSSGESSPLSVDGRFSITEPQPVQSASGCLLALFWRSSHRFLPVRGAQARSVHILRRSPVSAARPLFGQILSIHRGRPFPTSLPSSHFSLDH